MTDQKLKPCPNCETNEYLSVYKYANGWQHVECDMCFYLGPGAGNRRQAIKSHNERFNASASPATPSPTGEPT